MSFPFPYRFWREFLIFCCCWHILTPVKTLWLPNLGRSNIDFIKKMSFYFAPASIFGEYQEAINKFSRCQFHQTLLHHKGAHKSWMKIITALFWNNLKIGTPDQDSTKQLESIIIILIIAIMKSIITKTGIISAVQLIILNCTNRKNSQQKKSQKMCSDFVWLFIIIYEEEANKLRQKLTYFHTRIALSFFLPILAKLC